MTASVADLPSLIAQDRPRMCDQAMHSTRTQKRVSAEEKVLQCRAPDVVPSFSDGGQHHCVAFLNWPSSADWCQSLFRACLGGDAFPRDLTRTFALPTPFRLGAPLFLRARRSVRPTSPCGMRRPFQGCALVCLPSLPSFTLIAVRLERRSGQSEAGRCYWSS